MPLVLVYALALVVAVGADRQPLVAVLFADRHATVVDVIGRATLVAAGARVGAVEGFGDEDGFRGLTLDDDEVEEARVQRLRVCRRKKRIRR